MNNRKDKKLREWRKPTISKLEVSLTKGGPTQSNNENKNHWVFGGQTS